MWSIRKRLSVCGLITLLSIGITISVLSSSPLGGRHQIRVGRAFQGLKERYWRNESEGSLSRGDITVIVFGDSWVDDPGVFSKEKRGKTWPEVFCDEINCTSRLTFAASQPLSEYLHSPPTGVYTSHQIHSTAHNRTAHGFNTTQLLPDFETQVNTYLSLSLSSLSTNPSITFFLLSLGFWDIYSLASVNLDVSLAIVDQCVSEIFVQLERVKSQFNVITSSEFRVIIPKVLDPTISPGWVSQKILSRVSRSHIRSIVEEQKNIIYLTDRWNQALEHRVNLLSSTIPLVASEEKRSVRASHKYFYIPDFPQTLLGLVVEHYLKENSIHDATGLGESESSFKSVKEPCLHTNDNAHSVSRWHKPRRGSLKMCPHPNDFLWWDAWHVGAVGNAILGRELSALVFEDD